MLKVLLVDDEYVITQGLSVLIDWGAEGYEIAAVCSNGQDALDYLRENPVDLVIADVMMPVMTGLELLEKVKRERRCRMPALLFSAATANLPLPSRP